MDSDLPPEIWVEIFSHLHNDDHRFLKPLSLVSKTFLALTNSLRTTLSLPNSATQFLPSLFIRFKTLNSIDLSPFRGDPTSILLQIPRYYPHLHSLNLSHHHNLPFRQIGYRIRGLKVLTLSHCVLDDKDLGFVADCFPDLEELDISYPGISRSRLVWVTDAGICALSVKLKNLNRINISGNDSVTDVGVIALSINCVLLKSITMRRCYLVTADVIGLLLKNRPELEELFVNGSRYSFEFSRCLGSLGLSGQVVTNELLFSIGKGQFPLKSLNLASSCGFDIKGLESVLRKHRQIEHLELRAVDFLTDDDISLLSGFLSDLVLVDLSFCKKLTPMAFYYITRACPLLQAIKMRGINMLEEEEDSLMHFTINSQVRSLYLDRNDGLSNQCLEKFVKLCPNLRFLDVSDCPKLSEEAILLVMKRCSEITHLEINLCNIKNLKIDFDVPSLEVLRARGTELNEEALTAIGRRCCNLRHLDLKKCFNVSADGVKEVVVNCKRLSEINVKKCEQLDVDIASWMVLTRPSLRKIILPCGFIVIPSEARRNSFSRHGRLVCEGQSKLHPRRERIILLALFCWVSSLLAMMVASYL